MSRPSAQVTLSAANTGFTAETRFDAWVSYVADRLEGTCGFDVNVDAANFREGWTFEDEIDGTEEQIEAIGRALVALWETFATAIAA